MKGEYAGYLRRESGVHRLVRLPFGTADKRQTSFASVDVLPEIDDTIDIVLRDDELEGDVFRGAAARGAAPEQDRVGREATHIPTGIAAESRRERTLAAGTRTTPWPCPS